jgi:Family of unknown function (DUF6318)
MARLGVTRRALLVTVACVSMSILSRAVLAAALLTGCSSGGATPGAPATGSAATAATAATGVAVTGSARPSNAAPRPGLPAAAGEHSAAGAQAFFRYFVDTYNYANAALDAGPMLAVCEAGSTFCKTVSATVAQNVTGARHVVGGAVTIESVRATDPDAQGGSAVSAVITQAASQLIAGSGATVTAQPAAPQQGVTATLVWLQDRWRVHDLALTQ